MPASLSRRAAWALPILGGVAHALAFPPFGFMLVALVSLAPLIIAVRGASGKDAFGRGYLFGLAFGLPNMFWLQAFVGRWTGSPVLGAVPWLLVCFAFALYFGLFGWLVAKCWRLNWLWAIPLCWAAVEIFRSKIPYLYFPWSLSAASLFELPAFIQSAHFLGAFFVSAWISAFSVVAVMVMYRDEFKPRRLWAFAGTCIGVRAASVGYYAIRPVGESYSYGAVQPGVDLAFTPIVMQSG
jgi:apolipoprotein N-acyltransferase